jgi:hypothetical protein
MKAKAKIFFCYANNDEHLRKNLEKHLTLLKRKGYITSWHDRNITAGATWANEIDTHLTTADIILLLVSPDFMASDYCFDIEMKRAMERHKAGEAKVIPIILRPVAWEETPIGKLQVLPTKAKAITKWSNRDEAFYNVAEGIRQAVEEQIT